MASRPRGDYRIFVGAFPTGALAADLQALRERIDAKTARITPPHVTLAGTYWRTLANQTGNDPYLSNEMVLIEQFEALTGTIAPFELHLGGIATFGRRVVYLSAETTPALLTIRQTLLTLLGRDKHRRFTPHLTLAMRLRGEAFDRTLADLRGSRWDLGRVTAPIHQLQLMLRAPHEPAWRTIATLPLLPPNAAVDTAE